MANRRARRIATAALLAMAFAAAAPAAAETATLARGAMSLIGTPLDVALVPVTATTSFVRKYYVNGTQSPIQKAVMTLPVGGMYGLSCVIITGATTFMRFFDGVINVPVGLAVLGRDTAPDTALYEPVPGKALVDYHGIYFGGYHCEGFFQ